MGLFDIAGAGLSKKAEVITLFDGKFHEGLTGVTTSTGNNENYVRLVNGQIHVMTCYRVNYYNGNVRGSITGSFQFKAGDILVLYYRTYEHNSQGAWLAASCGGKTSGFGNYGSMSGDAGLFVKITADTKGSISFSGGAGGSNLHWERAQITRIEVIRM